MILSKLSCQWPPESESVLYNFCVMGLSLMAGWNQQQLKQKMFHKVSNSWTQSSKWITPAEYSSKCGTKWKFTMFLAEYFCWGQSFATWQPNNPVWLIQRTFVN
jgi:hypothetical protein